MRPNAACKRRRGPKLVAENLKRFELELWGTDEQGLEKEDR